jgi:hypothetical protein
MGNRAVFNTTAAPGAAIHVNTSRAFFDFHFEIASRPFHRFQIRIGDQFNVQMPADLDQFGRDDSHGTIVGGKSLIQLGHGAPDGRALFQQVHVIAGVCQIQGRLHAGNATAYNQYGPFYFFSH